jgi:hypothetical protein
LIKQRQPLLVRGLITQISTDEIQNSERKKRVQIAFEHALLIGQLAHALLQLNSFNQQLRRRFITALTLFFDCCIATRQSGQQGEISFPATARAQVLAVAEAHDSPFGTPQGLRGPPKEESIQQLHCSLGGRVQRSHRDEMHSNEAEQIRTQHGHFDR